MKTRGLAKQVFASACVAVLSVFWLTPVSAAVWTYPGEISVAEAYNDIYFTDYDTATQEGLAALVADHGVVMPSVWSATTARSVVVLAMESSSTGVFGILVNGSTFLPIKDPGPWTSPTRGWFDDPVHSSDWKASIVNIPALLAGNGFATNSQFQFVVGGTVMDATNTYRLNNNYTNLGFLMAYNEGGLNGGDGDANEPIIYVNPPTYIPGSCDGMRPTIVGTPRREFITVPEGTATQQVVMALGYADIIYGSSGDDIICAGDGNDIIYGGGGNDVIFGGEGNDRIYGEGGDDIIYGGDGVDSISGGDGNDQLYGDAGDDLIEGDAGDDYIEGGDGDDRLLSGDGNDTVKGNAGDDLLTGDGGDNDLDGGDGADRLLGGIGNDVLVGGAGDDHIYGDGGDDTVDGGDGDDLCDGGDGYDTETGCEKATTFEVMN